MQHAEGERDDEEFTAMQTTTEEKSLVNNKVAAVESKPDSGEQWCQQMNWDNLEKKMQDYADTTKLQNQYGDD